MSAAETPAEDDQPLLSLEVPMEAVPAHVVPRLELAVRVPPPVEPVEPEPESEPTPEHRQAGPRALPPKALEPSPSAVTQAVEQVDGVDQVGSVPPARPERRGRAAQSVRPVELDRRHPVRGLLGLVVIVVFGAIGVSLAIGAVIAAVLFAVRGGVGG